MFLKDMKKYLQDNSIELPIFLLNLPISPINCLVLYEYEGLTEELEADTETPALQILLRADNQNLEVGYECLKKCSKLLTEIGFEGGSKPEGVVVNGTRYLNVISASSGVIPLGKDDNGNNIFTKNFYITKER